MTQPISASRRRLHEHRSPNGLARALNRVTSPYSGAFPFHRWLYQASGGRIGHGLIGAPTLLLQTTGRRSGARRTTPVVYVHAGAGAVIGACNGGKGTPAWFYNLSADPRVEVQVGRQRLSATARVISPSDAEYRSLWQQLDAATHGRFTAYQARSGRPIPLVALNPDDSCEP